MAAEWQKELREHYGAYYLAVNPKYEYVHFQQEIIAPALDAVVRGDMRRLVVCLPFRHGKSDLITINFPPFFLGHHPDATVISLSYNKKLATSFGRAVKTIMQSDVYKTLFPGSCLRKDSTAKDDFMTIGGGHYYAAGFDGTINGLGANLLLIDDPIKNRQEAFSEATQQFQRDLYNSTIRTRLEPKAAVIIVTTRWTPLDLVGWRVEEDGAWDAIRNKPFVDELRGRNVANDSLGSDSFPG